MTVAFYKDTTMDKKLILMTILASLCVISVHADTSVYLDQSQLQQAQQFNTAAGNSAIKNAPQAESALSAIQLSRLNTAQVESEIKTTDQYFKVKPLKNTLPNGEKYYLYSESIVSDSQKAMAQYKKPVDLNKTIADYNALIKNAKASIGDNRLLIFISSSMPKKSIINLMTQASSIGAVFVVRGLINGSYVNTYKYFNSLKGNNTVGIMINPTLFSALHVETVPTYALYQSDKDLLHTACNVAPKYTKVSGDVTLRYALEQLTKSNNADLAQIATNELDILDSKSFYK